MKRRRTRWVTHSPEYYRKAYGGYIENWSTGQRPGSQAASIPKEGITMAKSTAAKVAEATEAEAAAAASTKGKAKTPVAPATEAKAKKERTQKVVEPISDAALAKLQKAKDAETDPQARAKLRRELRAALKSRGEYVPRSERPKAEKPAKEAKPSKTKDATPTSTKSKKSK